MDNARASGAGVPPALIIHGLTLVGRYDSIPNAVARRRYRLLRPTLALFGSEDGYVARPLPDDAWIEFDPDDLLVKGASLIEVIFEGQPVKMFASDLKRFTVPGKAE